MLTISLSGRKQLAIFGAKSNNKILQVMLDTGANIAGINKNNGDLLKLLHNPTYGDIYTSIVTPIGKEHKHMYVLDRIEIYDIVIYNMHVIEMDLNNFGVDLLLPGYVLKNNAFAISYASGKLVLDNEKKEIYTRPMVNNGQFINYAVYANAIDFNSSI